MLLPLSLCFSFEPPPSSSLSFFAFFQSLLCLISFSLWLSAIYTLLCPKIMTSNNLHSSTPRWSSFPIDLNEDHAHNQQFFLNTTKSPVNASSFTSASLSCPILANPSQGGGFYNSEESKFYVWHDGSYDNQKLKTGNDESMKFLICKKEDINENQIENSSPVKWMSSKMRLVKKMTNSDQAVTEAPKPLTSKFDQDYNDPISAASQTVGNNNNNSPASTVRVCSDCNTTKTPLWRSGPRGPKSLCNACGIRQRKARRAMAAAAASASTNGAEILNGDTPTTKNTSKVQHNKEKKNNNSHLPFKKRCKFTAHQGRGRSKKFGFEDLSIILSKNSAFHQRVFPQDEKEAAILLMALSYGLVHG